MRLSIITAVLNSPEVVRRHVLHYKAMPLPDDVEWIVVDDKSEPPLNQDDYDFKQMTILRHPLQGIWTQPAARNFGAKHAVGDYLLCTDIDHILSKELIDFARTTDFDFVKLRREVAVLNKDGQFIQTREEILRYGFEERRLDNGGFHITPHTNSFIIRRDLYLELGGVSERRVHLGKHPNREEIPLRKRIWQLKGNGTINVLDEDTVGMERPMIYMFPNGRYCGDKDYNPFGLFHTLERKTR